MPDAQASRDSGMRSIPRERRASGYGSRHRRGRFILRRAAVAASFGRHWRRPPPVTGGGPPVTGGVAQLGERLLCKQEVIGSIPFTSTISLAAYGVATAAPLRRESERWQPPGSIILCTIVGSRRFTASRFAVGLFFDM